MTADGFIIHLDDDGSNRTLTLKGQRKADATAGDNGASSYQDLKGETTIHISTVNASGSLDELDVVIPFAKFVHSKNHTISNEDELYTIIGSAAADTIVNTHSASNVSIQSGAKEDIIINEADGVYIDAGEGNDIIYLSKTTVNSGDGSGEITNDALTIKNVDGTDYTSFTGNASTNSIRGGKGNDIIYGNGNNQVYVFYAYNDGQDTIYNYTDKDIIHLGSVTDYYGSDTAETWENSLDINDLVSATYQNLDNPSYKDVVLKVNFGTITLKSLEVGSKINFSYIDSSNSTKYTSLTFKKEYVMNAANKTINNSLAENFIISKSATQQDTIINSGESVTISAGGGNDTIQNSGATTSIMAGIDNDTVLNEGDGVTIDGGEGNDSISNAAAEVLIYGGAGADTVTVSGGENVSVVDVSVFSGEGKDLIQIGEEVGYISIDAGKDDDVIELGTYSSASVSGGAGDDVILRTDENSDGGNKYLYTEGDGNDIIEYRAGDELKLYLTSENTSVEGESTADGYVIKITKEDNTTSTITLTDQIKAENGTYTSGSLTGGIDLNIKVSVNGTAKTNWQTDGKGIDSSPNNIFVVKDGVNTIEVGNATVGTVGNSYDDYEILNVGSDAKLIENTGDNVSINAGAGNDTIYNTGDYALINGNAGNDSITIGGGRAQATML